MMHARDAKNETRHYSFYVALKYHFLCRSNTKQYIGKECTSNIFSNFINIYVCVCVWYMYVLILDFIEMHTNV